MRLGLVRVGLVLAVMVPAGCGDFIEELLNGATGNPRQSAVSGSVDQPAVTVPPGPHLYCITNIGATLSVFSLAAGQTLPETRRVLFSDPVGPWFVGDSGYYISRVSGNGSGKNALIEFDPVSLDERRRLQYPPNSNPTTLLVLPGDTTAYVALRGSTFDNFASNGLSVVDLPTLAQTGYLDLNNVASYPAGFGGGILTSLNGLLWDAACALGPCAYAVANNWRNQVRQGWLLVLEPGAGGLPAVRDAIALGDSPEGTLLLDASGALWVVNNGGFIQFGGSTGSLQILDPATFADGTAGNETVATIDVGSNPDFPPDPTGLYAFDTGIAWLTSYPNDIVRTVDLTGQTLDPADPTLPPVTGPLFSVTTPTAARFAGLGGFGPARLGELDMATGALLADHDLASGNGTIGCAEHTVP